jgi:hypoxanthine phosphoribosyltransferase
VKTLLSAEAIAARVRALGAEIARDYGEAARAGEELVLACVLKGGFVFAADLARAIDLPLRIEFLGVQSYGEATASSGDVRLTLDLAHPVAGKHVLLVEDIVDIGLTLAYLLDMLRARGPASLKVCALLDKPSRRRAPAKADYLGFAIDDVFVVGYGLDHAGLHRNLPRIAALE